MKKALLLPLLVLLLQVQAQEGALDPTFGNGGFVHLGQNFSVPINRSPIPYSTAFTPEGKLVGVKITNNGFAVYRYDYDGAPDASFGQNGVVNLNIPEIVVNALNLGQDEVLVAVQDNGMIVVAVKGVTADSYQYVVALVRLTSTGFLDPTFGSGGIAKTFFQTQTFHHQPSLVALAVHTDGRIATLINRTYYRLNYYNINYNADGSLDNSWGGPSGSLIYTNGQIALGSDGSLVYAQTVTEYVSNGPRNLWLFLNGQSINTGSNVFSYEGVSALALQPDGKILVQSISGNLYRFFTDGTLDGTFGNGGVIRSPLLAYKILVQSNGKIIIGGETQNNVNHDFALARLNPDGALDPSFGIGGIIASDFGGEERIENMGIAGNRLYAYGSGILAAYRLNTTTPPCTPPTFLNTPSIVKAPSCGQSDGALYVIPTSGTAPFQYSKDGGQTYVSGPNAVYSFENLSTGTYLLRLKDANGCESAVVQKTLSALDCPPVMNTAPVISSFVPATGPIGTTVTISGANFSANPAEDIVYFGAVKATVLSATSNMLTVTVPKGASYHPITVTTGSLSAYSVKPFVVTFPNCGLDLSANSFAQKSTYQVTQQVGYSLTDLALGDFDLDGKPDLAVTYNETDGSVAVFRNLSANNTIAFEPKKNISRESGEFHGISVSDLDGNGKLDWAVANNFYIPGGTVSSGTLSITRNLSSNSALAFAPPQDLSADRWPTSVATSDFDLDGRPDLVVTNFNSNTVSLYKNLSTNGTLAFTPKMDLPTGQFPESIAIGDLDGDGKPDLVVANNLSNTVSLFRNTGSNGSISFAPRVDFATGEGPISIATGDLDGDSSLDVVTANNVSGNVSILRNTSAGGTLSFVKVDYSLGSIPYSVAIGDLDGDGKPDIVVTSQVAAGVSVFRNNSTSGSLAFASRVDYATEPGPIKVAIGDLDGDGKPDLIVVQKNETGQSISVLRNQITCSGCTPPTFLNNLQIVLDASECGNDGNISIIPLSGTAPFMYSIDGGATYVAGGNAGHTFQQLAAGTYQLRLKDANGCESAVVTREVRANVYPCNQAPCTPPTFLNNNQIVLDASCNDGDGAIYIIPISGTAPFMYSIDGGATYVSGPNAGYAFQNLAAGTYQLRLKDSKGCESLVVTREVKANAFGPCAVPALNPRLRSGATESATIRAYPNPSRGQFQVQLQRFASPKLQVQVLDSRGVVVQSRQVNAQETSTLDINLTGKAKGLYLIRVVSDKGTQQTKVLIQ